jgi:ankyrin repeat domain-containing protein 17
MIIMFTTLVFRSKKVTVPAAAITRVIGRNGCHINAIREVTGAHIEVDKQKGSGDKIVTIK